MSSSPENNADRIERLLDEKIDQAIGTPNHGETSTDDSTQQSLRLQDSIDNSLKRLFKSPEMPSQLVDQLANAAPTPMAKVPSPRILGLPQWVVAAVLLVGIGSWLITGADIAKQLFFPEADPYKEKMVAAIYRDSVSRGFKPDWFCEDEKQFAETFDERQGQGLLLQPMPDNIRMAGLAYLDGLSEKATCMLAWVEDQPVLLLVDVTSRIPKHLLEDAKGDDLQIFTRQLDDLTIIEVTPFAEPRVANYLYPADPPKKNTGRVPGT